MNATEFQLKKNIFFNLKLDIAPMAFSLRFVKMYKAFQQQDFLVLKHSSSWLQKSRCGHFQSALDTCGLPGPWKAGQPSLLPHSRAVDSGHRAAIKRTDSRNRLLGRQPSSTRFSASHPESLSSVPQLPKL